MSVSGSLESTKKSHQYKQLTFIKLNFIIFLFSLKIVYYEKQIKSQVDRKYY